MNKLFYLIVIAVGRCVMTAATDQRGGVLCVGSCLYRGVDHLRPNRYPYETHFVCTVAGKIMARNDPTDKYSMVPIE